MQMYIEVVDGKPVNHPTFKQTLDLAFGETPSNWEPFVRVEQPELGEYEKFADPRVTYEKVNDVWTDVYHILAMTVEEKAAKIEAEKQEEIAAAKSLWSKLPQRDNFSAWVFNEETIKYEPPIPRPTDRDVIWSGTNNGWVDKPQKPDDGKNYRMDFYTLSWVEIVQE